MQPLNVYERLRVKSIPLSFLRYIRWPGPGLHRSSAAPSMKLATASAGPEGTSPPKRADATPGGGAVAPAPEPPKRRKAPA